MSDFAPDSLFRYMFLDRGGNQYHYDVINDTGTVPFGQYQNTPNGSWWVLGELYRWDHDLSVYHGAAWQEGASWYAGYLPLSSMLPYEQQFWATTAYSNAQQWDAFVGLVFS